MHWSLTQLWIDVFRRIKFSGVITRVVVRVVGNGYTKMKQLTKEYLRRRLVMEAEVGERGHEQQHSWIRASKKVKFSSLGVKLNTCVTHVLHRQGGASNEQN